MDAVLFDTSFGTGWMVQAAAAATLLGTTLVRAPHRRISMTALAAGLVTASLASTGHATMDEGARSMLHHANDALHVLASGAWVGALLPLLLILQALNNEAQRREATLALRRFSSIGHGVIALVIATGVLNTVLILGRWPTDWTSPYQVLLCAKVLLVLEMVVVAVVNRYRLVPRLRCEPDASRRSIARGTLFNIVLGMAAILCVSVFGLLEPV